MQRLSMLSMRVFCLALVGACNDSIGPNPPPAGNRVTSVTITPPSLTMNVGDVITLVATVTAEAGQENRGVRWASGNAAVAVVGARGFLSSTGSGTTVITATSLAD